VVSRPCCASWRRACRRGGKPRERGELTPAEKTVVAAFTSGTISRESPIRVVFQQAVARPENVGAPLPGTPFRFDPWIKGLTVWAAPDRVEFRPAERLPEGQTYAASLDLRSLFPAGQAPLARFDFVFSTMRQSFDVAVFGLESRDTSDVKTQTLTGRLVTADVEDPPAVEKTLRASHAGRDLTISWAHEPNRRVHWVRTTLRNAVQERALEVVARHRRELAENGVWNAGALVLDVPTGEVVAYVGNHWPARPDEHGEHVDVIPAPRSTGSVLKPFLYASMLEAGEVLPAQLVPDVPTHIGSFHPENFDREYAGPCPRRRRWPGR
jgi:hypothetical protein